MAERPLPRGLETRESTSRPKAWAPPSTLPTPAPQDGWQFRWIRSSTLGQADPTNVSSRMREGWEPARSEDHPEIALSFGAQKGAGLIEVGGLVLCKMPVEFVEQRKAYYDNLAKQQMQAVNSNYLRENDPRMPVFSENKSEVRFGSGTK